MMADVVGRLADALNDSGRRGRYVMSGQKRRKPVHVPCAPASLYCTTSARQLSCLTVVQVRLGGGSTSGRRSD